MPEITQRDIDRAIQETRSTDPQKLLAYLENQGMNLPDRSRPKGSLEEAAQQYQSEFLKGALATYEAPGRAIAAGLEAIGVEPPLQVGPFTLGSREAAAYPREVLKSHGLITEEEPETLPGKVAAGAGRASELALEFAAPSTIAAKALPVAEGTQSLRRTALEALISRYRGGAVPATMQDIRIGGTVGAASEAIREATPEFPGKEAVSEVGGMVAGGIGESLARGLNRLAWRTPVIGRVLRGGTRLVPGAEEAVEQLGETAMPTAGHLSENPLVDVAQNVGAHSFRGFKPFQIMQEASEAAATLDMNRFVSSYLEQGGREEIGGQLQNAIEASSKARRAFGSQLYKWFYELFDLAAEQAKATGRIDQNFGIDIRGAARLAAQRKAASEGRNPTLAKVADWVLDMQDKYGDVLTGKQAAKLRSDLLAVGRTGQEIAPGQAQGLASELAHEIDQATRISLRSLGSDIETTWDLTQAFWRNTKRTFSDRFIRSVVAAEPEAVLSKVARKEMPGTLRKIRNIVLDPRLKGAELVEAKGLWKSVQGHVMLQIARDAMDPELQTQGKRALRLLDKFGEDTLGELFLNSEELTTFKSLLRTLKITQEPIGKKLLGAVAVQLGQAGALIALATGQFGAKPIFFVVGPELIRQLFTRKDFVRYITIGRQQRPMSKPAIDAYLKLQAMYNAEKKRAETEHRFYEKAKRAKQRQGVQP